MLAEILKETQGEDSPRRMEETGHLLIQTEDHGTLTQGLLRPVPHIMSRSLKQVEQRYVTPTIP
jgi:hypothetical protein